MHAVHLLVVLFVVTLYLITPHVADQQNQRNGDQDEVQRLQEELERTRHELAVEQRLGALERQLQQQNRELQSFKRKQKQVLRRLHGVETTLSERSHGNHQEESNAHMDSDEVIQRIESMDKQLAMLNDSHYQQDEMKLKQSEEVSQRLDSVENQIMELNNSNTWSEVHSFGSRQCVVNEDLYKALQLMKCKIGKTEEEFRVTTERVQQLEERHENVKEAQDAQNLKLNQLLAKMEASEMQLEQITNDKTFQSQATFYARGLRDGTGSNAYTFRDRLVYHTPLINPGGHYNSTSGEYTCPTSGVYLFVYSVNGYEIKQGSSHSLLTAALYREGDWVSQVYYSNHNSEDTHLTLSHTDVVSCEAGQRVWIQGNYNRNFIRSSSAHNVFGGVLLYTT